MAKKVIIVDDIDGTEGDGIVTQRFSLGSDFYEIDLCPQNLLSLRTALEPFVSAGRGGGNRRTRSLHRASGQLGVGLPTPAAAGGCTAPARQLGVGLPTRAAAGDSELGS